MCVNEEAVIKAGTEQLTVISDMISVDVLTLGSTITPSTHLSCGHWSNQGFILMTCISKMFFCVVAKFFSWSFNNDKSTGKESTHIAEKSKKTKNQTQQQQATFRTSMYPSSATIVWMEKLFGGRAMMCRNAAMQHKTSHHKATTTLY